MILTPLEYSKRFSFRNKQVTEKTIIRRCINGMLPKNHIAKKISGGRGQWVIEIPDDLPEKKIIATKVDPAKPDVKTINRRYFSFR